MLATMYVYKPMSGYRVPRPNFRYQPVHAVPDRIPCRVLRRCEYLRQLLLPHFGVRAELRSLFQRLQGFAAAALRFLGYLLPYRAVQSAHVYALNHCSVQLRHQIEGFQGE